MRRTLAIVLLITIVLRFPGETRSQMTGARQQRVNLPEQAQASHFAVSRSVRQP